MARRSTSAPGVHRAQKLRPVIQEHLSLEPGPDGKGECLCRQIVGGKIRCPDRFRRLSPLRCRDNRRNPALLHRLYKVAHLLLGANVSLCRQLGIGRLHSHFADFQVIRQRPFGGQLLPRRQPTFQNIPPNALIQGLIQGAGGPV